MHNLIRIEAYAVQYFRTSCIGPDILHDSCSYPADDTSLVLFGTDPSVPNIVESHNIKTYNSSDMCELPATGPRFVDPGYIHDVLLTGLKPSTTYFYSCGSVKVN